MDNMTEYIQLNDDIKLNDMLGNEYVIFRMYCNITAGVSINFTFDIIDKKAFDANKTMIQERVKTFKAYCCTKAENSGVDIFSI